MISVVNERGLVPARVTSCWPAHAVTPVASRPSLTTKSAAMKTITGSPNPARDCSTVSTPVRYRESATPIATIPTGILLATNATTANPRMTSVTMTGFI